MGKETSIHTDGSRETETRLLEVKGQTLKSWLLVGQTGKHVEHIS